MSRSAPPPPVASSAAPAPADHAAPPAPPPVPGAPRPLAAPVADRVALAALFQLAGAGLFIAVAAFVKLAGREVTPMQAVLYRSVFSLLPLAAVMARRRIAPYSRRWPLLAWRGTVGYLALYSYFFAISRIELANVIALQQLAPVGVALLSVLWLRERPRRGHWLLAALCLGGALLVVRPTRGLWGSFPALVGLGSAFFSAVAYVSVRALTRTEPTPRIVLWFSMVAALLAIPFALPGWRWPSTRATLLLAVAGLLAAPAQTLMTAAYRHAPAHLAAAFSYATVPLGYACGVLVWGERPEPLAGMGITLIVVGGVLLLVMTRRTLSPPIAGERAAGAASDNATG